MAWDRIRHSCSSLCVGVGNEGRREKGREGKGHFNLQRNGSGQSAVPTMLPCSKSPLV